MSKPITKRNKEQVSSLTIGSDHSILVGNVPEVIQTKDNLISLSDNFFTWNNTTKESLESLGFWGGDIDYNTYYPDLKLEDLKPKEDEFITPMFRLLSETIVSKNYYPTDFGIGGVLKASMSMLLGQTVNCDHETNIGNAIGAVSKVVWQNSYQDGAFKIPGGINGILKIDGKANPRIARGILMDPPSIHSNSVTVQFKWDKSHPEMDDDEFYSKIGQYDAKNIMVRRIVTEIIRYAETSLVSHGADAFAQKIGDDGKIVNPKYATRVWNSYKEYEDTSNNMVFFEDKSHIDDRDDNTSENNIENPIQNSLKEYNHMTKEEFIKLMADMDKLSIESSSQVINLGENTTSSLSEMLGIFKDIQGDMQKQINDLNSKVESLKEVSEFGKAEIAKLREKTLANYKKIKGESFDEKDPIYLMINSEVTPLITIQGINKGYEEKLEEMFPMRCSHCGSTELTRASSVAEEEEKKVDETSNSEVIDNAKATENILARKNRYQG